MKKTFAILLALTFLSGCGMDNKNALIKDGMYMYVSAPYKRYYDNELNKYFSDNVARDIKQLYMPIFYNGDEIAEMICFEEGEAPDIEISEIEKNGENSYIVKVKFGQSENIYDVSLSDKKISYIEKRLIF